MTIRRMLHATDFSPASRPALALARALAKAFKAELILFHAWERAMPVAGVGYISASVFEGIWKSTRQHAERNMKRLAKKARSDGLRITTLLAEGPPAAAIGLAAKNRRADLIVIGTHGRTGVKRFLLGSVAERVVRTASCPVLTVGAKG